MQKRTVLLDLNVNLGFGGNKALCNVFILGGQRVRLQALRCCRLKEQCVI